MNNQNTAPKGIPQDYDDNRENEDAGTSLAEDTEKNKEIAEDMTEQKDKAIDKSKNDDENPLSDDEKSGNSGL